MSQSISLSAFTLKGHGTASAGRDGSGTRSAVQLLDSGAITYLKSPQGKQDHLFRTGDSFRGCYILRSGSVKTYRLSYDGCEKVTGFYFAGDIVGLDAIFDENDETVSTALQLTAACEISRERLFSDAGNTPDVFRWLLNALGRRLSHDRHHLLLLRRMDAETRLATFLRKLSETYRYLGGDAYEFELTMNRADVANYLGVSEETISRVLTRFQKQGLIKAQRKLITILDPQALWQSSMYLAGEQRTGTE